VRILLAEESRTKSILALSGAGKVREYRLTYRVVMAVLDSSGKELGTPTEILLTRDFSFSDAEILAKSAEEATLNRAMEQDALRQVLRRLSFLKR
jgi:LPS-assembly lipoprotein